MAQMITIPKLGLTMESGIITHWYVEEGDFVSKGDPLFELHTDKLTNEVESPEDAYVIKILAEKDREYDVYSPVCVIGREGETYDSTDTDLDSKKKEADTVINRVEPDEPAGADPTQSRSVPVRISPVARKLADENGIDITTIVGTGPGGRITKEDVEAAIHSGNPGKTEETPGPHKLSGIRKIIAQRMAESKRSVPHVYFRISVDATGLLEKRNKSGKKISFNDMIIAATAQAIGEFPVINARYADDGLIYRKEINIGLAVDLEEGLIVPVIKNANKSIDEISAETSVLIEKAKNSKLLPDDLSGGTFTMSNLGMYDIDEFTAIINPGESAILAVGKISDKAFPVNGELKIRPEMTLTLSVDHRIIDGAVAARFLSRLKSILESYT